jgi:SAM-dependent methyltransferase
VGIRGFIWDRMYRGEPSWELGGAEPDLVAALEVRDVSGGRRALDLGCGTGDNAIELARRGFDVTAIDIAPRPLERAHQKAETAGVRVDFRLAEVTSLPASEGPFDLIVDRGLLMSLFGRRARRAYVQAIRQHASTTAAVFQHQWVLPQPPRPGSRARMAIELQALVLAPDELASRLGGEFDLEVLRRSIEAVDDPGIRRFGITEVAKTSYWLTRRQPPPRT